MLVAKFKGMNSEQIFNSAGGTNWSEAEIKFQQDVKHLLETPLGSMLGNLTYGSKLYQLLFLPVAESTGVLIQEEIKKTIESNYTDIKVPSIDVSFSGNTVSTIIRISNGNSDISGYINVDFERSSEI